VEECLLVKRKFQKGLGTSPAREHPAAQKDKRQGKIGGGPRHQLGGEDKSGDLKRGEARTSFGDGEYFLHQSRLTRNRLGLKSCFRSGKKRKRRGKGGKRWGRGGCCDQKFPAMLVGIGGKSQSIGQKRSVWYSIKERKGGRKESLGKKKPVRTRTRNTSEEKRNKRRGLGSFIREGSISKRNGGKKEESKTEKRKMNYRESTKRIR